MQTGRRPLFGGILLVTVAIGGLLSMHGLDGVVNSLTDTHHTAQAQTDHDPAHSALGICVFVGAIAGLGVAAARLPRRAFTIGAFANLTRISSVSWLPALPGRTRLSQLCVLRL